MATKFNKSEFHDILNKEIHDNILPFILNNIVDMGESHLKMLVGKQYEIKINVDEKELKGNISAPGADAIRIEEENQYFAKTFAMLSNCRMISKHIHNQKIVRITSKYLPDEK